MYIHTIQWATSPHKVLVPNDKCLDAEHILIYTYSDKTKAVNVESKTNCSNGSLSIITRWRNPTLAPRLTVTSALKWSRGSLNQRKQAPLVNTAAAHHQHKHRTDI